MARTPTGPRYRADRDAWVVQIDGRLRTLAKGKKNRPAADREFRRIMVARDNGQDGQDGGPPLGRVFARYLADLKARVVRGDLSDSSRRDTMRRLADFPDTFGGMPASSLSARVVREWLDGKAGWSGTTKHDAVGAIKSALNWAVTEQVIPLNPIRDMPKPERAGRRELVVDPDLVPEVIALIPGPEFGDLARFLWLTGARPKEARELEARWIDWDRRIAVIPAARHKTGRKTKRSRVIHLPEPAMEILAEWLGRYPDGPIFRNRDGKPWTKSAINCQIRGLRERSKGVFGREVVAYALRHVFATEALERTGDLAGVATLLGHTGTALLSQVYSHLDKRHEHVQRLADQVRPAAPPPVPSASLPPGGEPPSVDSSVSNEPDLDPVRMSPDSRATSDQGFQSGPTEALFGDA